MKFTWYADRWKEQIPQATVTRIAAAGHMLSQERVDEVAAALVTNLA